MSIVTAIKIQHPKINTPAHQEDREEGEWKVVGQPPLVDQSVPIQKAGGAMKLSWPMVVVVS